MPLREPGWECPKCLRIWAPRIAACGACNARQTLAPDQVPSAPSVTINMVDPTSWNFTADDLSYRHQDGDTA